MIASKTFSRPFSLGSWVVLAFATLCAPAALAQAPEASAAASAPSPICADRPLKASGVCTAAPGHFQIEADAAAWSHASDKGVRSDSWVYANPTVKYGLNDTTDVQISWSPWTTSRTKGGGLSTDESGVSDLTIKLKHRFTAVDAPVAVAILPFVKIPTAPRELGNRKVEGGVSAPIAIALPGDFSLSLGPELDVGASDGVGGVKLSAVNVAGLSKALPGGFTLGGELWMSDDLTGHARTNQRSADVAVAWLATPSVQLDAGANFGLNRKTADVEAYVGVAFRL